jgi:GT2 family glycosyltransferase
VNYSKVAIIVLNWNGKEDTLECLESILKIDYPNFEIIVVDNGSSDDSVKAIKNRFPEICILETGENLGYAGGNNFGIRYALQNGSDYILILNNDIIVDPQLVNSFIDASAHLPKGGIFGAKIYYFSAPNRIWCAGTKWSNKISAFNHLGFGCIDDGTDFNSLVETDYACGCVLFIRADVLNKIGLFDEDFYLTFEETDLCYRAKREGFNCYFVPNARVWHKVSASFGGAESALIKYFRTRNKLLWAERHLPLSQLLLLYKRTFYALLTYILPPRFRFNRRIINSITKYKKLFINKYNDPARKAKLRGVCDYFWRRFGNCPELIRSLNK